MYFLLSRSEPVGKVCDSYKLVDLLLFCRAADQSSWNMLVKLINEILTVSFKPRGLVKGKFVFIWSMLLTLSIHPTCVPGRGIWSFLLVLFWLFSRDFFGITLYIACTLWRLIHSAGSGPSAYTHTYGGTAWKMKHLGTGWPGRVPCCLPSWPVPLAIKPKTNLFGFSWEQPELGELLSCCAFLQLFI